MKVVVFAQTPPPTHGQSYMVKLMLDELQPKSGANSFNAVESLQLYHVNLRLSGTADEIGKIRWTKIFRLLKYVLIAVFHRLVYQADVLYYVPAPGKRSAVYRDWIVMALCRPFFRKLVLHWEAAGLGEWLETEATSWERRLTNFSLGGADQSVVLSELCRADALRLAPRQTMVVPNAIPDPCPDFATKVWPTRNEKFQSRGRPVERGAETNDDHDFSPYTVLFLATCTAEKGLFATLDAIALARGNAENRRFADSLRLVVAGSFVSESERARFDRRIAEGDLNGGESSPGDRANLIVRYAGFVSHESKDKLLRDSDCLCLPTMYPHEAQPVAIIEALAYGLPVVATNWRAIPELLAGVDSFLVSNQEPRPIAEAMAALYERPVSIAGRERFLARHSLKKYATGLRNAFASVA